MEFWDTLERASSIQTELPAPEQADAQQLIAICYELDGAVLSEARTGELKRECGRLAEVLARRSARAMPLAALARAVLAHLQGAEKDAQSLLEECRAKLALFGH